VRRTRTATARSSAPTQPLAAEATTLCVATVPEALALRDELPAARLLVLGPASSRRELAQARDADLALVVSDDDIPEGVAVP